MTDHERNVLLAYVDRAMELRACSIIMKGLWKPTIRVDVNTGESFIGPEEENLTAFMTVFRHFYMSNEDINFEKVRSLVRRQPDLQAEDLQILDQMGSFYHDTVKGKHSAMRVFTKDKQIMPENALDFWLNGKLFHTDLKKDKWLAYKNLDAKLGASLPFLLQDTVIKLSVVILHLAGFIKAKVPLKQL